MFVSAIIAAGGRGERLGRDVPKQLLTVGGRTMLERSLEPFERCESVDEIVVVLPSPLLSDPPGWLLRRRGATVRLVAGGPRRQDSVAQGLGALSSATDIVVIHDAARPFCSVDLIERTIEAAAESGAAIAALPVQDTLKRGVIRGGGVFVSETVPRDGTFLAQTPQAFRRSVLEAAVAAGRSGHEGTDEAALAERAGQPVCLVTGDPRNLKVTTEEDLAHARRLARALAPSSPVLRVGLGYDLHRLAAGRRLVLGGVDIPAERGLDGHSDADVVCHAVTDAVLGGANAGDIGQLFPDDDDRWAGAASLDLLARAMTVVREQGFVVENVDVVVIADWPKMREHGPAIRRNLADALGIDVSGVGIKGKTSEGVGAVGREAIAVHAIALVRGEASGAG